MIGRTFDITENVRCDNYSGSLVVRQFPQQTVEASSCSWVKTIGWLIQQVQLCMAGYGRGYQNPTSLPLAERVPEPVRPDFSFTTQLGRKPIIEPWYGGSFQIQNRPNGGPTWRPVSVANAGNATRDLRGWWICIMAQ